MLVEEHLLRGGDGAHAQIEVELVAQELGLFVELVEQGRADGARADEPDRERLVREHEARVHGAKRALRVLGVDHHGDVSLAGALRDGADVDARAPERAHELPGDAELSCHLIAHGGEDAA